MDVDNHLTLDRNGTTSAAIGKNGGVRVALWTEQREPHEDPIIVNMTPGQALKLARDLLGASQDALAGALK